jgi:CheY-like chemotaxis protein
MLNFSALRPVLLSMRNHFYRLAREQASRNLIMPVNISARIEKVSSSAQLPRKNNGGKIISILLAEDDPFIAMELELELQALGLTVVGPFGSVEKTSNTIQDKIPDLALLDVNLMDGDVYPVADALHRNGVPLIFHTGSRDSHKIEDRYRGAKVICKPADWSVLRAAN